jgi:WD40 repeat protein
MKGVLDAMFWGKVKGALLVLPALGVLVGAAGGVAQQIQTARPAEEDTNPVVHGPEKQKPKPGDGARLDLLGDPLSPGTLARLGTDRMRHDGTVNAVAFSGDGKTVIAAGKGQMVRSWDIASGKEMPTVEDTATADWVCLATSTHGKLCLALSSDGATLALGGDFYWEDAKNLPREILLYDAGTGKELRRLESGPTRALAFSPDGKTLAATAGARVVLWDVATGAKRRELTGFKGAVSCVAFTPDGRLVAAGGQDGPKDGVVRFWETATGKDAGPPLKRSRVVEALAFSPDGKTLATGGLESEAASQDTLTLWDVATRKETGQLMAADTAPQRSVMSLAYSRDGKTLASSGQDYAVHLWDPAAGKEKRNFRPNVMPGPVALSPDGKTVAAACGFHVRLWDVETGKEPDWRTGHRTPIRHLAYAPDGKTLASTAAEDATVCVWEVGTGKLRTRLVGHQGPVRSLAISADGKTLATTGSYDRTARLWDLATGKELLRLDKRNEGGACDVALSPAGDVLVLGGYGETLAVYSRNTGRELRRLEQSDHFRPPLEFSPDGKLLAAGNGTVGRFWDVATGKVVHQFSKSANGISFHWIKPPGRSPALVWGGGDGGGTYLWDVTAGKERKISAAALSDLDALSPDGRIVARVDPTREVVTIAELTTGREVAVCRRPKDWLPHGDNESGWFRDLAFSPDGRTLLTSDPDHWLHLWEVETGQEIRRWGGPETRLYHPYPHPHHLRRPIAFAPDGRTVSASDGDTVLVWDVTGRAKAGGLPPLDLKPDERDRLWGDLRGENAPRAHDAIWAFVAAGDVVVPFLAERLVPEVDARRLTRLIADLDSEEFTVREAATAALEKLNVWAEAALRQALKNRPPLEALRRIEALLEKAGRWNVVGGRALQVLEQIGTPEARKVLEAVAKGDPENRLTQEARASLERLPK